MRKARAMLRSPRVLLAAALLLGLSVVWVRPGPTLLIGGDAGCYARVGRELSERPLDTWLELTLAHEPFFEHPPLALWLEGLVVRWFGPSPAAIVGLARLYASLTLLALAAAAAQLVSRRGRLTDALDGPTLAAFTVLGALTLPGFLYTSQVAMLEAPLSLALAVGLWALAGLLTPSVTGQARLPAGAVAGFAAALLAGFWVKGPPALVLVGLAAVAVALRWLRPGLAALAVGLGLAAIAVTTLGFDAVRERAGLGPFFATWLEKQVIASATHGRHNPDPDPLFYVGPTLRWYGPALGALALGGLAVAMRRRLRFLTRLSVEAVVLGAALWLGVVVGFSLPVQKYQWYIHPGLVGASLLVGAVLALVPGRVDRFVTLGCLVAALAWPLVRLVPWESRLSPTQQQTAALQAATGPGRGEAIADCSPMDGWVSGHLMGFLWDARRVSCESPAPWRFDGQRLDRAP